MSDVRMRSSRRREKYAMTTEAPEVFFGVTTFAVVKILFYDTILEGIVTVLFRKNSVWIIPN